MKKILSTLIFLAPFIFVMVCSVVSGINIYSDKNIATKGTCLETFTVEHWHKHSAPTTSVHSVVRVDMDAYVINGDCKVKNEIPWEYEHRFILLMGYLGLFLWILVGLVILFFVIGVWWNLIKTLENHNKDSERSFWKEFVHNFSNWWP